MEQMSSEQALNGIFGILQTMIAQQNEKKEKEKKGETNDKVKDLINGLIDSNNNEKILAAGQQLEQLAIGLNSLSNIDEKKLDNVGVTLEKFSSILKTFTDNSVSLSKDMTDSMANIVTILSSLSEISNIDIKKLDKFGVTLNKFSGILKTFTESFADESIQISNGISQSIQNIAGIFNGLSSVLESNIFEIRLKLSPRKARRLGRVIGNFISEIAKSIDGRTIDSSMKHIGDLLDPIIKLGDENNKFSIANLKQKLNKKLAKSIASFFKKLDNELALINTERIYQVSTSLMMFIQSLGTSLNYINKEKIDRTLNKDLAISLASFIVTLDDELKSVDGKEFRRKIDAVTRLLNTLAMCLTTVSTSVKFASKILNKEEAQKINEFIIALIDGDIKPKKVEAATKALKSVAGFITILTGILIAIVLLVTFAPLTSVVVGILIMKLSIDYIKNTIRDLVDSLSNKDVKSAHSLIKSLSYIVVAAVGMIGVIAIITSLFGIVSVGVGLLVMWLTLKMVSSFIEKMSDVKIKKQTKEATKTLQDLSKFLLYVVGAIAILSIVAKFTTLGDMMQAVFTLTVIVTAMVGIVWLMNKIMKDKDSNIKDAIDALKALSFIMLGVSLIALFIFPPIAEQYDTVLIGTGIVMLIIVAMTGIVHWLSKIETEDLQQATTSLAVLTGVLLGVSLIAAFILPSIAKKWDEAAIGAVVVLSIIAAMTGIVHWLSKIEAEDLQQATISLAVLTGVLLGVSLIASFILPGIGKHWKRTMKGAAVVLGIIGLMTGIVWLLSKIEPDNLHQATTTIAVLTVVLLAVSLIAAFILPDVGKHWKRTLIGAGIVIGIVGMMALITLLLGKIDEKELKCALIAMGVLTVVLLAVSLIAVHILPEIGKNWENALIGGGVTLAIIAGMGLIIFGLSFIKKNDLLWGLVALAGLTLILGLVAYITKELLIPIGEKGAMAIWGAGQVELIITATAGIMVALGWLIQKFMLYAVTGAATMVGIAGVLWAISEMLDPFLDLSIKVDKNSKAIWSGSGQIAGLITAVGVLMAAIGAVMMTPAVLFVLAGAATITGIAGVMALMVGMIDDYIHLSMTVKTVTKKEIDETQEKTVSIIESISAMLSAVSDNSLTTLKADAIILPYIAATKGVFNLLEYAISEILKINKLITIDDLINFNDIMWKNPENSLLGSLNTIIREIIKDPLLKIGAALITKAIKPVLDTVSQFVDIIMKVAKGTYIIGYDNNGKPIYQHIKASEFGEAGVQVTERFKEFLQSLTIGFSKLNPFNAFIMRWVSKELEPVLLLVSKFVDVVMKVAKGTYITGYDDNGKPVYEHISAAEFGAAGTQVSLRFAEFLIALNKGFESVSLQAISTMKKMKKILFPIIDAVSEFVDIVMKVATGTYVTGYDDNGKPELEHLTAEEFGAAGTQISQRFRDFLLDLNTGFKSMEKPAIDAIKKLKDSMKPIMESVSSFVDAIIKVASAQIITGYDDKDKPIYEKIENTEIENAGTTIGDTFGNFITKLVDSVKLLDDDKQEALEVIADTMKPIMDSVSSYVDSILKFATGQYIDSYEKDSNGNLIPHFTKLDNVQLGVAAVVIKNQFTDFITKLTDAIATLDEDKQEALEILAENVQPVMDGVSNYVNAIMLLATGTYIDKYEKDEKGKYTIPHYAKVTNKQFEEAAIKVAGMFIGFVKAMVKHFSQEDFKSQAEEIEDIIKDSVDPIMEGFKKFTDAIMPFFKLTTPANDKGTQELIVLMGKGSSGKSRIEEIATDIASSYTSFVGTIANHLKANKGAYNDIKEDAEKVDELIKIISNTVKKLVGINKEFLSVNAENSDIKTKMTESVDTFKALVDDYVNYFKNKDNTDFSQISEFINSFTSVVDTYKDAVKTIKSIDFDYVTKFGDSMLSLINYLKQVNEQIKQANLFKGVNEFISSINKLTSETSTMSSNIPTLSLYTNHLTLFANQITVTTNRLTVYIKTLDKAQKALKKLDDQIINKAKPREDALERFNQKINNIADAFSRMTATFEELDTQAMANRISEFRDLLEAAGIDTSDVKNNAQNASTGGGTTNNNTTNIYNNGRSRGGGTTNNNTTNNYNNGRSRGGNITVYFSNKVLDGTYTTK